MLKKYPYHVLLFIIGIFLCLHSAFLGLTDDEAYYWVLAQSPAWGYAYHPPIVAWCIWVSEKFFGLFSFFKQPLIVRAPAILFTLVLLLFFIQWLKSAYHDLLGYSEQKVSDGGFLKKGLFIFLAFAGIFGVSWMMVPDLPLMIGYVGIFHATWKICFSKVTKSIYLLLAVSVFFAILSKFTAVFAVLSCFLSVWFLARPHVKKTFLALCVGFILGVIPIVIWNAQNEWGAFLYQFQDRHQGSEFSWVRYGRFWLITFVGVGPIIFFYFFGLIRRVFSLKENEKKLARFIFLWVLPAALVFCIQPAFSDFKPHWVLLVIFPIVLEFSFWASLGEHPLCSKIHRVYGYTLMAVFFLLCHLPFTPILIEKVTGKESDPRWDITNDMYGWKNFYPFVVEKCGAKCLPLPVVGSRYQTASQAAFAWPRSENVSRVPRTKKEYAEFPMLPAFAHQGPEWPDLLSPVLFVADIRYHQAPSFPNADCQSLGKLETYRWSYLAKWVEVYYCEKRAP